MEKLIINKSCQYLVDTYMKEMQYYKKLILSTYTISYLITPNKLQQMKNDRPKKICNVTRGKFCIWNVTFHELQECGYGFPSLPLATRASVDVSE